METKYNNAEQVKIIVKEKTINSYIIKLIDFKFTVPTENEVFKENHIYVQYFLVSDGMQQMRCISDDSNPEIFDLPNEHKDWSEILNDLLGSMINDIEKANKVEIDGETYDKVFEEIIDELKSRGLLAWSAWLRENQ